MTGNMPWFRFYSETIKDRKIIKVAQAVGVQRVVIVGAWATVLAIASTSPARGKLLVTLHERFNETDIADEIGLDETTTKIILEAFVKYEMLHVENGVYCVTNWDKRQFDSDNSTERVRKFREKRSGNVSETDQIQIQNQIQIQKQNKKEEEEEEGDRHFPASDDPACEAVYRDVTSQITFPAKGREDALSALRAIMAKYRARDDVVGFLKPYFQEWLKRGYTKTNVAWLSDWAVTETIPIQKEKENSVSLAEAFRRA